MGFISSTQNLLRNLVFGQDASDIYYSSSTTMLSQNGVIWMEVDRPANAYETIPQLKGVIDKKAIMFSAAKLKLVDKDGKEKDDITLMTLLENPNPLQSQNEWMRNFKQQEQVYGNEFMYKNQPSILAPPVALWNISPRYMKMISTGKIFDQTSVDSIIEKYEYLEGENKRIFDPKDILHQKISSLDNPLVGTSPIVSLKFPITNIKLAYEYRNAIHSKRGALGMIVNKQRDSMGSIKLSKTDRDELEKENQKEYGAASGQKAIKIVDIESEWQHNAFPVKELMLFEEIDANMITICDAYGLNVNIFSTKNSTYENVKESIKQSYQDTIIPEADQFCQSLTKFLGLQNGDKIVADFTHIQVLRTDEQKEAQTLQSKITSINQLVATGIISPEMALNLTNQLTGLNIEPAATKSIVDNLNRLSPLVSNNVIQNLTINEIRSVAGLPPVADGDRLSNAAQPTVVTNA
jgi:phage portal protein BeeE